MKKMSLIVVMIFSSYYQISGMNHEMLTSRIFDRTTPMSDVEACYNLCQLIAANDISGVTDMLRQEPFVSNEDLLRVPNRPGGKSCIQVALNSGNAKIFNLVWHRLGRCATNNLYDHLCNYGTTRAKWEENGLLHEALRRGSLEIVCLLLENKENVDAMGFNYIEKRYETPIFIAVYKYHECKLEEQADQEAKLAQWLEIIKALLNRKAQILIYTQKYFDFNLSCYQRHKIDIDPFYFCQQNDLKEILELFNNKLNFMYSAMQQRNSSWYRYNEDARNTFKQLLSDKIIIREDDGTFLYKL